MKLKPVKLVIRFGISCAAETGKPKPDLLLKEIFIRQEESYIQARGGGRVEEMLSRGVFVGTLNNPCETCFFKSMYNINFRTVY